MFTFSPPSTIFYYYFSVLSSSLISSVLACFNCSVALITCSLPVVSLLSLDSLKNAPQPFRLTLGYDAFHKAQLLMTSAQATTRYYSLCLLSPWSPALLLAPVPRSIREVLW